MVWRLLSFQLKVKRARDCSGRGGEISEMSSPIRSRDRLESESGRSGFEAGGAGDLGVGDEPLIGRDQKFAGGILEGPYRNEPPDGIGIDTGERAIEGIADQAIDRSGVDQGDEAVEVVNLAEEVFLIDSSDEVRLEA